MNENDFLSTNKQSLPLYIIILISVGGGLFVVSVFVVLFQFFLNFFLQFLFRSF